MITCFNVNIFLRVILFIFSLKLLYLIIKRRAAPVNVYFCLKFQIFQSSESRCSHFNTSHGPNECAQRNTDQRHTRHEGIYRTWPQGQGIETVSFRLRSRGFGHVTQSLYQCII